MLSLTDYNQDMFMVAANTTFSNSEKQELTDGFKKTIWLVVVFDLLGGFLFIIAHSSGLFSKGLFVFLLSFSLCLVFPLIGHTIHSLIILDLLFPKKDY